MKFKIFEWPFKFKPTDLLNKNRLGFEARHELKASTVNYSTVRIDKVFKSAGL